MVARVLTAAVVMTAVWAGSVQAQSGRVPAEVPPADYSASQYVDSNGCVFVRAGFNGGTSWVPRFDENRRPMCGYAPTFGGSVEEVATAPAQSDSQVPAQAQAQAPRPAPAPVTIAAPEGTGSRITVVTPTPRVIDRPVRTPSARVAAERAPRRPAPIARVDAPVVYPSPTNQPPASPGEGDWTAWDGLNPRVPNAYGYAVPPRQNSRWQDAYLQGNRATSPVGDTPRRSVSAMGTVPAVTAAPAPQPAQNAAVGRMTNGQYVQIGTFGTTANAQAAVGFLRANGMPVAVGRATSAGSEFQIVLAGPFSPDQLQGALGHVRALGYRDAFVR